MQPLQPSTFRTGIMYGLHHLSPMLGRCWARALASRSATTAKVMMGPSATSLHSDTRVPCPSRLECSQKLSICALLLLLCCASLLNDTCNMA